MHLDLIDWVKQCEQLGAGEICLNSIDTDGVRGGFDLPMLKAVCDAVQIPVIARQSERETNKRAVPESCPTLQKHF